MRIDMDRSAISKVLFNDRVSLEEKAKIAFLAEDFLLIKNKVKPKKTIGLTFFYVKICKNNCKI